MPISPPLFPAHKLLGCSPDDPSIQAWLHTVIPTDHQPLSDPLVKRFPDCTYYSYKSLGISFCFVQKKDDVDKSLVLDSIDIYNGKTRDGFQPFVGNAYPFDFTKDTRGHEIVSQLGEPDRKGGGGKTHLPCWIEYKFTDQGGGLFIQLHGVEWEDRDMGWTSLSLFA
ncbi:hypothetical protein RO3G_15017 [Lichtheimia corymbifera JMRC:FSU:9682]|uniref:Uncharacterized protein n=1 Tax=Lichtheimia corymbifera JMRC:FSU:9682 TaxID=1263082 RepID=A0A068SIX3_9FUNG|nr:hypothetical protein RO3G_15017 [Lichtheimia corymbifera JMRC:FSU:9682]